MRLPAAERRRPTLWDAAVVLAVAAAALLLFFQISPSEGNFLTATVVLDGEVIAEYDLSALTDPVSLRLDDIPYPLTIQAEPGWVDRVGAQIICLPNRLVISLSGAAEPDFDAVSG